MTKWRTDVIKKAIESLEPFKPSTTIEEGNLIEKPDWGEWQKIQNKEMDDWEKIKKSLKPLNLGRAEQGWIWNWCAGRYNWRGWANTWGLLIRMELDKKK